MAIHQWILTEDIDIMVLHSEGDQRELLIDRVFGPGATVLKVTASGEITVNGLRKDLGDDAPAYRGIFDYVIDSTNGPWPEDGFTCRMCGSLTRRAVRSAVSVLLSADDSWTPRDADNIIVNTDGTWCSPGTFASIYGSWELGRTQMRIAVYPTDEES
jgi:hypothetical protein